MQILANDQIRQALATIDVLPMIEQGFVAYSDGRAVVPPVGELQFEQPPGEVHIKYGYIRGEKYYVIKVASGFYQNPLRGLPSGDGLMLLFEQETGRLATVLLDEGHLTDVRTAAAGAIAAKYLAPQSIERIGILGSGVQARLQLQLLRPLTDCRRVLVWGRHQPALDRYRREMEASGFEIETTTTAARIGADCNLIITCTPATEPLLTATDVRAGAHVTAVGSDTPDKQELSAEILGRADLVVADSRRQCRERGEIAHALAAGLIREEDVRELGEVIAEGGRARTAEDQITVADLTGVAVQDIQIAKAVHEAAVGST